MQFLRQSNLATHNKLKSAREISTAAKIPIHPVNAVFNVPHFRRYANFFDRILEMDALLLRISENQGRTEV